MWTDCLNMTLHTVDGKDTLEQRVVGWEYGPRPIWGVGEIDGLHVPPSKASNLLTDHLINTLLTDHLITGYLLRSEPAQGKWFSH